MSRSRKTWQRRVDDFNSFGGPQKRYPADWTSFSISDGFSDEGISIDTNVLIKLQKDHDFSRRFFSRYDRVPIFVSSIAAAEFFLSSKRDFLQAKAIMDKCTIIEFTTEIRQKSEALRRKRKPKKLLDAAIAATALIRRIPLMTDNTKDFNNIGLVLMHTASIGD